MKIYGYVRVENGRFDSRKKSISEIAKSFDMDISEMIYEDSDDSYDGMKKLRRLLEREKDFILIVSDASDIFEDGYSRAMFLEQMDNKNVFLIDSNYPDFDYKMLIEKYSKNNPFNFLSNNMILALEIYARKREIENEKESIYNDMRQRMREWIETVNTKP